MALKLRRRGDDEFHGFRMAQALQAETGAPDLIGNGTLYKALSRLEGMGMLTSRWEDQAIAAAAHRPPRRLYTITAEGQRARVAAVAAQRLGSRTAAKLVPTAQ